MHGARGGAGRGALPAEFPDFKRLPYALAYALTLVLTLWAACIRRLRILTVVFASMQIGFLGWSALMHMPGGGRGALLVLHGARLSAGVDGRPAIMRHGLKLLFWETRLPPLLSRNCSTLSGGRGTPTRGGRRGGRPPLDDVRVAGERREAPSR